MARSTPKTPTATPATPECVSHPGILARLLLEMGGSHHLGQEARGLLFLDPTLCLHTLRIIASAHPHALLSAMDLQRVLAELDASALKQLALAGAVAQLTAGGEDASSLDLVWRQAVTAAVLSRALAEAMGYRNLEEAWLAGLLTHLPAFVRHAESPEAARLLCLERLERLPLRSFLPDVLRYLDEPAERLRDAAPLVRCALAAHRLLPGLTRDPVSPPADGVFLSQPIATEALREMLHDARKHAERLGEPIQAIPGRAIADEVVRYGRLEAAAHAHGETADAAIAALANGLAAEEGLYDPVYLALNKRNSTLESRPLGADAPPPISLRMEGSNTAAVRALYTRSCVVVYRDAADGAVLDQQLIRQANAEGLAALPVGEGGSRGVLLVCGDRDALEKLAADPRHYTRLGELSGSAPILAQTGASGVGTEAGALAARVRRAAHEVNNPLGIIKNYLAILKVKLGDDAPVADELRIIHEELDRTVRIVRGLLHEDPQPEELDEDTDINALIEDMVKVTAPTWHAKGVRVTPLLAGGLPRLPHDRDKLKQIVLNLLLNALEATPEGGTVRLETAAVTSHRRERFLEILVADSGPGIPAEKVDELFGQQVATDKGDGHAGLGLAIVKTLAESLNGFITFKSNTAGTTFQISLPLGVSPEGR
ncbi:MAG: ATP-binding protein [Pseudomonadota bacterium]